MKLSDLGRLVAQHLAQGKGDWEVNIFQWEHQSQPVTDFLERPGILEFYSDTDGEAQECQEQLRCSVCGELQFETPSGLVCIHGHGGAASLEEDDIDDLI